MNQSYQGQVCTYLIGIEYAGINTIQVRREEYRTCAHIFRELNVQAQDLYQSELPRNVCRYPLGIEHAGTGPIPVKITKKLVHISFEE